LRGRSALETGLILLPMAISSGILVTQSGRLYDRLGPRPLMVAGFAILAVNTWQLAQLRADTSISWIIILLILRGLALGLTVQTTLSASLSQVPLPDLARGSSLNNAARNVVQAIGVAVLATVLASTLSPQVKALQNQFIQASPATASAQAPGLCEPGTGAAAPAGAPAPAQMAQDNPGGSLLQRACQENVAGFERSYRLTFYAALIALVLGALLPGWPAKWHGRQMKGAPAPAH
jgi:DHA2 family multidrug resistance protein